MNEVRENFNERAREIDSYIRFLRSVQEPEAKIVRPEKKTKKHLKISPSVQKTLKASVFLLSYNNVEATVRETFNSIYTNIESDALGIQEISDPLRQIWLEYKCRDVLDPSSSWNSYKQKAAEIVSEAISNVPLRAVGMELSISGNIDGDLVRKLCLKHDLKLTVHKAARGGVELGVIKQKRNELAHGNRTFDECGREYDVEDLCRINKEANTFLKSLISSVERFVNRERYKPAP